MTLRNKWNHLVTVVDRQKESVRVYSNGELRDSCSPGMFGSTSNNNEVRISGDTFIFKGQLDEVRVYSEAITSDRVALEYYNVTAPDHLLTVHPEEPGAYPL